ncbi:hypothetical protein ACLH0K_06560 [Arthrobacter sp. MPF02]|uniref:hypothetical protein n=1 Tax=Arthrobacter sp. MPF02 TaxID=3388492 RepID=UPI003984979A
MSSPQEPYQPGHAGAGQQQLSGQPHQGQPNGGQQPNQFTGSGPLGLPGEEPPAKRRPKLWIVLTAIGGVLLLVVLGVVILVNVAGSATTQAKGLADGFTRLVIAGDSSKAYDDYLDPALQEQLSKETFIAGIQSLELDEGCEPAYNDLQVATENGVKSADIAGLITCDGKNVDLAYRFEGTNELKMTNIKLRPAA